MPRHNVLVTQDHVIADTESRVAATVDLVLDELRAAGHRVTLPRRAVIDVLARSQDHPTVDQIAGEIGSRWPGIHLTTVYRTLETLAEVGVVNHVHLASGAAYYLAHIAGGHPEHVHAQCRRCHRVIDVPTGTLDDVRRQLEDLAGFRLEPHHVALSGLCADCTGRDTSEH